MCIRPILLYASPIWSDTSNTNYERLQRIPNECLRMARNAKPGLSIKEIHKQTGLPKIKDVVYRHTTNFYTTQIKNIDILCNLCCEITRNRWHKYKMPQMLIDKYMT